MAPTTSNSNRGSADNWIHVQRPVFQPKLRLFCFSYAGGNSSTFRDWHKHLPEDVEVCSVQLPGRGSRFKEEAFTSLEPMLNALAEVFPPYTKVPYVCFGHSMGAQVAFELVRTLRDRGYSQPECLIVSGRRAPQLPARSKTIHSLPENEFREELRRLNGTPDEALNNPELMDIVSPILRADFQAIETWQYQAAAPLNVPLLALGGVNDKQVTLDDLEHWRAVTQGSFGLELFSGDHFFINQVTDKLLNTIGNTLNAVLGRSAGMLSTR